MESRETVLSAVCSLMFVFYCSKKDDNISSSYCTMSCSHSFMFSSSLDPHKDHRAQYHDFYRVDEKIESPNQVTCPRYTANLL